jgi:signal transduction histidine kinase
LSVGIYAFVANMARETLEPLLILPIGQATLDSTTHRLALAIFFADLPLLVVVGIAAYIMATISVRPLAAAREREQRFTAEAAHELRTPLATIASVAQAARGGTEQDAALDTIASTAIEASTLVGDLLLLMRESPEGPRLHEPVDLSAVAALAAADARILRPEMDVVLSTIKNGAYIIGDAGALQRLARNLVGNAIQHARSQIAIDVKHDGTSVTFAVSDDGTGVADDDRERIFERFVKADPAANGAGLGLAICRKITAAHGGTVVLEERTRFVARFPAAPT